MRFDEELGENELIFYRNKYKSVRIWVYIEISSYFALLILNIITVPFLLMLQIFSLMTIEHSLRPVPSSNRGSTILVAIVNVSIAIFITNFTIPISITNYIVVILVISIIYSFLIVLEFKITNQIARISSNVLEQRLNILINEFKNKNEVKLNVLLSKMGLRSRTLVHFLNSYGKNIGKFEVKLSKVIILRDTED